MRKYFSVVLSVFVSVMAVALVGSAATTISTDISTGGTLSVTGASTLTGNVSAAGTLAVTGATTLTGLTTMGYASTTGVSLTRNLMVNGFATTTGSNGDIATDGFIGVGPTTTPAWDISVTSIATSTATLTSSTANVGGCLQLRSATGTLYRMYIGADDMATTTTNGEARINGALLAYWERGSCNGI